MPVKADYYGETQSLAAAQSSEMFCATVRQATAGWCRNALVPKEIGVMNLTLTGRQAIRPTSHMGVSHTMIGYR